MARSDFNFPRSVSVRGKISENDLFVVGFIFKNIGRYESTGLVFQIFIDLGKILFRSIVRINQCLVAQTINYFPLFIDNIVIFDQIFPDIKVVTFDLDLDLLDNFGNERMG